MKIKIITFGKIKNSELSILESYYLKLCGKYFKIEKIELKDIKDRKIENKDIEKYISNQINIFLSEEGKEFSTSEFTKKIQSYKDNSTNICFFVGNAFGFDDNIKKNADLLLSLSKMTYPHEMARVMLVEQIFRIGDKMAGGKYHKD